MLLLLFLLILQILLSSAIMSSSDSTYVNPFTGIKRTQAPLFTKRNQTPAERRASKKLWMRKILYPEDFATELPAVEPAPAVDPPIVSPADSPIVDYTVSPIIQPATDEFELPLTRTHDTFTNLTDLSVQTSPRLRIKPVIKLEEVRQLESAPAGEDESMRDVLRKLSRVLNSSSSSSRSSVEVDPEERISAEARLFDLDNKSGPSSIRAPSPPKTPPPNVQIAITQPTPNTPPPNVQTTIRPTPNTPPPKVQIAITRPTPNTPPPKVQTAITRPTPIVTGAFVDTPMPPRPSNLIAPTLPAVIEKPVATRPSTIEPPVASLQSIIEPPFTTRLSLINTARNTSATEDLIELQAQLEGSDFDHEDFLAGLEEGSFMGRITPPVSDADDDDEIHGLSAAELERRSERLALNRMTESIKKTSSSIRDARHGIERLEQQVSSSIPPTTKSADTHTIALAATKSEDTHAIALPTPKLEDVHKIHIKVDISINLSVPALTKPVQQPSFGRNWKFTWLGLTLFLFGLWFVTESAVCSQYCHQKQSRYNDWNPSDPFFPWAIPTKIGQLAGFRIGTTYGSSGSGTWWMDDMGIVKDDYSMLEDETI